MKQNNRRSVSVKWKIFGSLLIFISIIITVLWLFQVFFLEKFYMYIKSNSVKSAANEINEVINEYDYKDQLNTISKQNEFCVIVYGDNGYALYKSEGDPRCNINNALYDNNADIIQSLKEEASEYGKASKLIEDIHKKEELPLDMLLNGTTKSQYLKSFQMSKSYQKNFNNMTYISVVENNHHALRTIIINAQLTPVNATVETIKTQFIMIAAILVLIAIGLALYLSRKISKPIIAINDSAKKLADGNYEVSFKGKGYLEIQELSDTLNYASKELSKVEGLRRELIANMSHDLRTPLTMISGYGEVMRDIPGENTPENVQIIIDETTRLTNLVNDMLDLSKLQAGVQELASSNFNLTCEICNIIKRYDKLLSSQDCTISFSYDKEVWIQGDIVKLDQVIYNLINNAINYCGDDHKVMVSQTLEDNYVDIQIADHGPGMDQEQLPYIWDRYYKVDKTHVRSKVGSGLGLSIVKAVLELHKAVYGVHSEVGKGTIFWFRLPYTEVKGEN